MHTETITWHPASTPLDDDRTVLVQVQGEDHAWLGYRDAGEWISACGERVHVLAWAEVPVGPGNAELSRPAADATQPTEVTPDPQGRP